MALFVATTCTAGLGKYFQTTYRSVSNQFCSYTTMDYYRELMQKTHQAWLASDSCFIATSFCAICACNVLCCLVTTSQNSKKLRNRYSNIRYLMNSASRCRIVVSFTNLADNFVLFACRFYVHSESQELPPPYATRSEMPSLSPQPR